MLDKDIFGLLTDGPKINPLDLLEDGNVDIARLEGGGSCGELCLIDGKPRMATVKCLKRTHFLILNKELYNAALNELNFKNQKEKINFLKETIPVFNKMHRAFIGKFADRLEQKTCVKDQILYKEGDTIDYVYIVRKGEFVVTRKKTDFQGKK